MYKLLVLLCDKSYTSSQQSVEEAVEHVLLRAVFVTLCNSKLFISIPSAEFAFSLSFHYCQCVAVDGSVLHLAAQLIVMTGEHLQPFVFHHTLNRFYSGG